MTAIPVIHDKPISTDGFTLIDLASPSITKDELANRLVQAENKRKNQLPRYPGLERFEMIRKLGDGAFSNVFEARDLKTGKKVAIKVAQKSNPSDKNANQRHLHSNLIKKPRVTERANIIKEVQIMKNIRYPNIVQLIHFMETPENYFLTLDLCEGGELFHQIVKLTYFSEDLARHVITQVAQAVRYLHECCGVVHRDIKPENILFDPIPIIPSRRRQYRPSDNVETKEDEGEFVPGIGGGGIGRVRLADFGLSKVIWNNSTFTPCGTVGYTAPEIVRDKIYSKSVDMWAIGCVLYTILCGFPPFYDESIPTLTEKVARGEYTYLSPWWDTISGSVKDLISHLLCVDVKKRYTISQFLNHPWIRQGSEIHRRATTRDATLLSDKQIQQHVIEDTKMLTPPEIEQNDSLILLDDDNNSMVYTTPDPATLRGIFDITYAVQRMGEEQTFIDEPHDNIVAGQQQQHSTRRPFHPQVPLSQQVAHNLTAAQKLANKSRGVANPTRYQRPPQQQRVVNNNLLLDRNGRQFNLDLNNATLLNNRRKF
ncbi:MAG: serine/threonine-protein kinase [Benjaminiella poitrasii]|nr:MAG: serine/threonine-protein kinase [Benjaminiella poitrasii]